MTNYKLQFKKTAAKELFKIIKSLSKSKQLKLKDEINALASNPRPANAKKLKGYDHLYRIRIDRYRVVYTVEDDHIKIVEIILIAHRNDVYQLLEQIF